MPSDPFFYVFVQICPFPIFTRSGEVSVSLELTSQEVELTDTHIEKIVTFLNYTFTNVLRLQKYLMMFDPHAAENSYFIVPTRKGKSLAGLFQFQFSSCLPLFICTVCYDYRM